MENQEKVLQIVKEKGPVLPVHIAKEIGVDILLASAMLSELTSNKQAKVTHVKIGGSPLYYVVGQEPKLINLYNKLNDKEKKAYDLLKSRKIIKDNRQEPVIRAALRQIRDFAKPIEVTIGDKKEIFWKWFLITNTELQFLIKDKLKKKVPERKRPEEEKKEETKPKEQKPETIFKDTTTGFISEVRKFFNENKIEIFDSKTIRKNSDMEFTVKIPTSVGFQKYYCRAKKKKRCNEGDISSAYVQGEFKKMPVLFLIKGDFTKKAKEMLNNEFKNITIRKI